MARRWLVPLTWVACTLGAMGLAWFAVSSVLSGTAEQVTPVAAAGSTTTTAAVTTTTSLSDDATAPSVPPDGSAPAQAPGVGAASSPFGGDGDGGGAGGGVGGGVDDGGAPLPSTPPSSGPSTTTGTFSSLGGVVTASCTGTTAALVSASPQPGYHVEVEDNGPDRVRVRFESGAHTSDVRVTCPAGQPVPDVNEQGG